MKHPDQLPQDYHCPWREEAEALREDLDGVAGKLEKVEAELEVLKRHVFGRKSEKMPPVQQQLRVGDGRNSPAATAKRRERAAQKAQLPEELIHHRIPDAERHCPKCGGETLRSLGEGKMSSVIEYVPSQLVRQVHVQETLACRCGEGIITAPAPAKVVDKGQYGPGFIAHAVVAKCADSVPLYRLEKIYGRHGAPIARSTLIGLFHLAAELLHPVARRLLEQVAAAPVVNADETPLRVQAPGQTRRGYLWTFVAGRNIAYKFSPSRSGETPSQVLGATQGALVVDGPQDFLFVGSDEGGENLASLYTLIATCEANRINLFRYLRDILIRVQTHPQSQLDDLLPQRWAELFGSDSS